MSFIDQFKGVPSYYDSLRKRMLLKLVMFRLSSDTQVEMTQIEKLGVNVGGFGDTTLPVLFFAS